MSQTKVLGQQMRAFRDATKGEFNTVELPGETAARRRRSLATGGDTTAKQRGPLKKELNLQTYKFHALGDYVQSIRLFGTVDSYSTQLVCTIHTPHQHTIALIVSQGEFAHRVVKRLFALTNKKDAVTQIATKYRREARSSDARAARVDRKLELEQSEIVAPELHHHISGSRNTSLKIRKFLHDNPEDPAKKVSPPRSESEIQPYHTLKDFLPKLRQHLLARMLGRDSDVEFHDHLTDEDRNRVCIVGNKIFSVKTLRVNYTTYDVRREQDTINPRTHPFIMVKTGETTKNAHPFWYAQVLGVYHASVFDVNAESTRRSPHTGCKEPFL